MGGQLRKVVIDYLSNWNMIYTFTFKQKSPRKRSFQSDILPTEDNTVVYGATQSNAAYLQYV